tara:strand:- start:326 stop:514 length:189 start_codon:yes stop_codon:yes gene_type:complete
MHEEHKEEIKMLKASIKHYEEVLEKPDHIYFDGSSSHRIAIRIISRDTTELKNLELLYEVAQ